VVLIEECQQMKLTICPPDINLSEHKFTVNSKGQIVYGLGAIKGVGEAAVEEVIISERNLNGSYTGLYDLCKRVDLRKVNKRVLEALIKAGAFDEFNPCRASHFAELPTVLRVAEQHSKMAMTGQNDLFGLAVNHEESENEEAYSTVVETWSEKEKLDAEKSILGLYLSGHPIDQYVTELRQFTNGSLASMPETVERTRGQVTARVAGLVIDIRVRQTKSGKTIVSVILDDRTGRLECTVFGETYERYREVIARDTLLIVEGGLAIDTFANALRLNVEKILTIEQARSAFARSLQVQWTASKAEPMLLAKLAEVLQEFKGGQCPLELNYQSSEARAILRLGDEWRLHVSDVLITKLRTLFGQDKVEMKYR
jgi:DNA polymerase-3 subunit alpha